LGGLGGKTILAQSIPWLSANASVGDNGYDLTPSGAKAVEGLGIDLSAIRTLPAIRLHVWIEARGGLTSVGL
jgi:hypothetical protein